MMSTFGSNTGWLSPKRHSIYYLKEGTIDDRDIIGLKGANLCEMHRIGLPVPPAFMMASQCCQNFHKEKELNKGVLDEIKRGIGKLETKTGKKFGGGDNKLPLLLSVRSSAGIQMPGMLHTVLNLGMNKSVVKSLGEQTDNPRWAMTTYVKFLETFGITVMGVDPARYEEVKDAVRNRKATPLDSLFTIEDLQEIVDKYKVIVAIPGDPLAQLHLCVGAAFKSWYSPQVAKYRDVNHISEHIGVAVVVQAMVFGNLNLLSGSGQVVTRNPSSGEKKLTGSYLANAEGDELLEHQRVPMALDDMQTELSDVYESLSKAVQDLERHFKDAQEVKFTVEDRRLFILETGRCKKRNGRAAVRIAVEMVAEGLLTEREALLRVDPAKLEEFVHPMIEDQYWSYKNDRPADRTLGRGKAAGGGAVSGKAVFTPQQAVECWKQQEACIFVHPHTSRDHLDGLKACVGSLTELGSLTSHAATTMRSMHKAAVVGLDGAKFDFDAQTITSAPQQVPNTLEEHQLVVHAGDIITLDGSSGFVYLGEKQITLANQDVNFQTIMMWAERYKSMGVQSVAMSAKDVTTAKRLGAEGIGLYQCEEFFVRGERADMFRHCILATDELQRVTWLSRLQPLIQHDFLELFEILGNCELSVRLLDPPLQIFVPNPSDPHFERDLRDLCIRLELTYEECLPRVMELQQSNPMLGFRGCRLSILYPEITEMLTRAIVGAAVELKRRNFTILPKIVLPFASSEQEVDRVASLVSAASDSVCAKSWMDASNSVQFLESKVAVLIETPRACYRTDAIARTHHVTDIIVSSDRLTDLVFGMNQIDSLDFLMGYLEHDLVAQNPFTVLDEGGVGSMIQSAVVRAQRSLANVKIGVTGAHAAEPDSIAFFQRLGVHYLVCSPFRVPAAKLAAAQANIQSQMTGSGTQLSAYKLY